MTEEVLTQKDWTLGPSFGLDGLHLVPSTPQVLAPTQVRLAIKAVSLNYRDHLMVDGLYNPKQPLPLVPCSDGAGEIVEVGTEVVDWTVGQRVCPIFAQDWLSGPFTRAVAKSTLGGPLDGTLRQSMVVESHGLVAVPDDLSFEEASTLPCAALTAWNALNGPSPMQPGQSVLILGTGGVSIFALQFAKQMGLKVGLLSSSDEKLERARLLGADWTHNYRIQPQWAKAVLEWSGGVDRVVEVGGAGTLNQSLRSLKPSGEIAMIGILAGAQQEVNVLPILMQQLTVRGILVGNRHDFQAMLDFMQGKKIQPAIDRCFEFGEVRQAFEHLRSGQHFGKIVVRTA